MSVKIGDIRDTAIDQLKTRSAWSKNAAEFLKIDRRREVGKRKMIGEVLKSTDRRKQPTDRQSNSITVRRDENLKSG